MGEGDLYPLGVVGPKRLREEGAPGPLRPSSPGRAVRDEWDSDKKRVFKDALKDLSVGKPIRLVLYGLAERRGDYFAIPTAPEDWVLREEFPKEPFIDGALPEVWVGVPYRFRRLEEISEDLLKEFVSWVEEYLAQLELLAAVGR